MYAKVMWLCWVAVLALMLVGQTQAGVIRTDGGSNVAVQRAELDLVETTTAAIVDDIVKPEVPLDIQEESKEKQSRDEEESVKLAPASLDSAPDTLEGVELTFDTVTPQQAEKEEEAETSTLKILVEEAALSRDEEASIQIAEIDAAQDLQDTEEVFSSAESNQKLQKSAKLLLLSTPKLSERNRAQEEDIEDPDDIDANTDATNGNETTELSVELAEEKKQDEIEKTVCVETKKQLDNEQKEESTDKPQSKHEGNTFVTRLFGIRDSIFDTTQLTTETPMNECNESKNVETTKSTDSASVAATKAEEPSAPHNDNVASSVLIETESDYVLVDADAEQWGSFTHADSEVHLQPIVQSVEVVPTHFDEPLLVSYVHAAW